MSNNLKQLKAGLAIITVLLILLSTSIAGAVGIGGIDMSRPDTSRGNKRTDSAVHLNLNKNESFHGEVNLSNTSEKPITAYFYAADALPAGNGGIALKGRRSKKRGLARWISVSATKILLAPHETKTVTYDVKIPNVTSTDEYLAGLVVENAEKLKKQANKQFTIAILQRAAIIVTQRLPGPSIEKLRFLKFSEQEVGDKIRFDMLFENAGSVHLNIKTKIRITDFTGGQVKLLKTDNLGTILPRRRQSLSVLWDDPPIFGIFKAKATAAYGHGKTVDREMSFVIFPWWLLVAIVLAMMTLVAWRIRAIRRKRQQQKDAEADEAEENREEE